MLHIIVTENLLLAVGLTDPLDHRVVIPSIRKDEAIRHQLGNRRNAGLVRDVAGGKNEGGLFAVQIRKLALKFDQRVIVAGDVASTAGAGPGAPSGLDHGADHLRVLAHAKVIVRAPDHHVFSAPAANAKPRVGSGQRCARDRQRPDNDAPTVGVPRHH